MVRRTAAEPAALETPPVRVTRARTKNTVSTKDAAKAKAEGAAPAPTRGRPRTKLATSTSSTSSISSNKLKTSARAGKEEAAPKRAVGRPRKVVKDIGNVGAESSADEMDIVSTRNATGRSSTQRMMTSSLSSMSSMSSTASTRARQAATQAMRSSGSQFADDKDSDDDELAAPQPVKRKVGRPRTVASSAERGKTTSAQRATKTAPRPQNAMAQPRSGKSQPSTRTAGLSSLKRGDSKGSGAVKKKVTFLDITENSDKENVPVPTTVPGKKKPNSDVGLTAKPARRGATTSSTKEKPGSQKDKEEPKKDPLSPKKATQVAKSGSSGSSDDCADDDDVFGTNRMMKSPIRSPIKVAPSSELASPAKKINFNPTSPRRGLTRAPLGDSVDSPSVDGADLIPSFEETLRGSPARRPPPSPYKDTLKETPKRAMLFPDTTKLFSQDAKLESARVSPLKESPRKAKLAAAFSQPLPTALSSPTKHKESLLQSPAKRPPSPTKSAPPPPRPIFSTQTVHLQETIDKDHNVDVDTPMADDNVCASPAAQEDMPCDDFTTKIDIQTDEAPTVQENDTVMEAPLTIEEITPSESHSRTSYFQYPSISADPEEDDFENKDPKNHQSDNDNPDSHSPQNHGSPMGLTSNSIVSTPPTQNKSPEAHSSLDHIGSFGASPSPALTPLASVEHNPPEFNYRDRIFDDASDLESVAEVSPAKSMQDAPLYSSNRFDSPSVKLFDQGMGFTPLAEKLDHWKASSPEKQCSKKYEKRGLFSPAVPRRRSARVFLRENSPLVRQSLAPDQSIVSDNPCAEAIHEDEPQVGSNKSDTVDVNMGLQDEEIVAETIFMDPEDQDENAFDDNTLDQQLEHLEFYGDENAPPQEPTITLNPQFFEEAEQNENVPVHQSPQPICLPMSVTPVRVSPRRPRTIHTVSKVPLKPSGDDSLIIPKKRSRSVSTGLGDQSPTRSDNKVLRSLRSRSPLKSFYPPEPESEPESEAESEDESETFTLPERPKPGTWSGRRSPSKSPTKTTPQSEQVLRGAVVFVNVHTAEGADASGIFVELLTQMGARCVKSWHWNPRASLSPVDGVEPREAKVGITHVVFKDGGVRTLEKVRESRGVVKCVGVGWVLDCERENRWVDEMNYAVDTAMIPRGGNKRRKSMEPRALGNKNGTLIKLDPSSPSSTGRRRSGADPQAMQEFMRLSPTPQPYPRELFDLASDGEDSFNSSNTSTPRQDNGLQQYHTPSKTTSKPSLSTPTSQQRLYPTTPGADTTYTFDFDAPSAFSPTTPYYLTEGAKLVQQTCPPKQLHQGLFSGSDDMAEEQSAGLRFRLEAVRRKSLVWKPKVGSPLGKQLM